MLKIQEILNMKETNIVKKDFLTVEQRDKKNISVLYYKKDNCTLMIDIFQNKYKPSNITRTNRNTPALTSYPIGNFDIYINKDIVTLHLQFDENDKVSLINLVIGLDDFDFYDYIENPEFSKIEISFNDLVKIENDIDSFIELFEITHDFNLTKNDKYNLRKISSTFAVFIKSLNE